MKQKKKNARFLNANVKLHLGSSCEERVVHPPCVRSKMFTVIALLHLNYKLVTLISKLV